SNPYHKSKYGTFTYLITNMYKGIPHQPIRYWCKGTTCSGGESYHYTNSPAEATKPIPIATIQQPLLSNQYGSKPKPQVAIPKTLLGVLQICIQLKHHASSGMVPIGIGLYGGPRHKIMDGVWYLSKLSGATSLMGHRGSLYGYGQYTISYPIATTKVPSNFLMSIPPT
ncbi:hypothetical protein G9A89_000382, partial [Geosiphon pyriformis]